MNAASPKTPVIGVRDSGVGGLTVAVRILEKIPQARLIYFADTANVPYGDKTPEQVRFYALSISQFLLDHGAQALVFACNTTSAYALRDARCRFAEPVIGVIEPGSRAAAAVTRGKIGVLATSATVQSQVYTGVLQSLQPSLEVLEVACPAFVPLVEARQARGREALEACKHYMAPLLRGGYDTVILGCTHYPLLLPLLREVAPEIHFVDPADTVADDLAQVIDSLPDLGEAVPTRHRFFVSGEQSGVAEWIHEVLGITHPALEIGPVFNHRTAAAL